MNILGRLLIYSSINRRMSLNTETTSSNFYHSKYSERCSNTISTKSGVNIDRFHVYIDLKLRNITKFSIVYICYVFYRYFFNFNGYNYFLF